MTFKMAKFSAEKMIEQHGDLAQIVIMIDLQGNHRITLFEDVLHGDIMRDTLKLIALSYGGIDAMFIVSDARMKVNPPADEIQRISDSAARGEYILAEDTSAQECLMTLGRSRENTAYVLMPYSRTPDAKGDIIRFKVEPKVEHPQFLTTLIPDIWEKVN